MQATEKTEAGNTAMASTWRPRPLRTYLGGGDLSWQAINWSTPDALQLWFDLAAADYALKTEQDAAQVVQRLRRSRTTSRPRSTRHGHFATC